MKTALIIHGHFYQPPRENPWTGIVEPEPSARPYHDWNERIHSECYRPNGFARVADSYGRVERIVNNYTNLSFNFGPTLFSWLEQHYPETMARILEADRESVRLRGGHGNAIAQAYNHIILPLANRRDQLTQVRWGLMDFRHRFGRDAESLWLPETACNDETLGLLIDEGLRYAILSPYQAERVRAIGGRDWQSVADGSVDTTVPYKYFHRDGSGRSLTIFFYDGPIARAIAFEGALASSQGLVDRFERAARGSAPLVNVATDGESYGHHFHFGDRCLAYALEVEAKARGLRVTNYGEFLDQYPPALEVEIKKGPDGEGTAWSCAHGVGRWRRDCGCQTGAQEGWNQAWRAPLRLALDYLRDEAARHFEAMGGPLFRDPWATRDAYIELIVDRQRSREEFLRHHTGRNLKPAEVVRALTLLESQRNAMLMYTSCGWFFADISGIETLQVMKYAARVIDQMDELGLPSPGEHFLEILAEAKSNILKLGTGADVYRRFVETCRVSPARVSAHLAISSLVDEDKAAGETAGYIYRWEDFQKQRHGRITLATGHLALEATSTTRQSDYSLAAMHFGDVDFYCVLQPFPGQHRFTAATDTLWRHFRTGSLPAILRLAEEEFGPDEYGLEHLLPGGRQRVSEIIFGKMVERFSEQYEFLYEENRRNIEMLLEAGFELPRELRAAAEFTLGRKLEEEIRQQQSQDAAAYERALEIAGEVARHGYRIDRSAVRHLFEDMIVRTARLAVADPTPEHFQSTLTLIELTKKLGLDTSLEQAQEVVYQALQNGTPLSEEMKELAGVLGLSPNLLQQTQLSITNDMSTSTAEAALR